MKLGSWRRRLSIGAMIAAGTAGSMVIWTTVSPAGAATSSKPRKVAVRQGITAASLHAARISAAPATTKMKVSFVLEVRNAAGLESAVQGGMHQGFLSVSKFASQYGQTLANITALEKYLSGFGITSTAYADRLDISTTGTAAAYTKALSAHISLYRLTARRAHDGQPARPSMIVHGTASPATLPANLASFVYAVLGLTSYPVAASNAVHTPLANHVAGSHATQLGNRTPGSFASQYGLTSLYNKGFKGQGETLGIITYASVNPADPAYFWSKVLKIATKANRIKLDNIDGGSGPVSAGAGSGETTLDVEQSGALAPQADIVVYQAPNTDYGQADAWFTAASQNTAASVSTSWGESEILNEAIGANGTEAATYGGIFDEAGLEMAAQGQSAFDAAGDAGAYDDAFDTPPYTELSVDNPANSPWITAAGGTTEAGQIPLANAQGKLAATINIAKERAWAWDYLYPYYATLSYITPSDNTEGKFASDPFWTAGGGGGYSVVEPRPSYQNAIATIGKFTAVPYLTPANYVLFGTTTSCTPPSPSAIPCVPTAWTPWTGKSAGTAPPPTDITGSATGRAVPDISADADPDTGYELYYSQQSPKLEPGWGGTSFVAPQFNGAAAVIDSFLHHRSGFWNPEIYKFAAHSYTPFHPLSTAGPTNDNLYYTGTAGTKYNPATGLGTPSLGALALNFKYRS
ncbi:MAG TPA: S53 family peptidase [Streptosporangiaceae bacterium]|nr:S53 family peptidase [Streptosporangiaceae bacterium]